MRPARIMVTAVRPGHTARLQYGRDILIAVDEVHVEPQWIGSAARCLMSAPPLFFNQALFSARPRPTIAAVGPG
jgi:hypothetical protein